MTATIATYCPVVSFDFTNWDDPTHITQNPRFLPPKLASIPKYWEERQFFGLYIPVTYSAWTLVGMAARTDTPDALVNHLNPYVFHAANLILHVGGALLVLWILTMLMPEGVSPWGAVVGALVFALHPLQVESVAWVAGFRDVFAGALCLASIGLFVRANGKPKLRSSLSSEDRLGGSLSLPWYIGATIAYVLALLSKPGAVVVPVIAGVLAAAMLRRRVGPTIAWLAPWIVLAIPVVILTKLAQPLAAGVLNVPVWERPLIALDSLAWYLYKLVLPFNLAPDYGRNPDAVRASGELLWTWAAPFGVTIVLWLARRRLPRGVIVGAIVFLIALAPVLGLVTFDFQAYSTVADHYTYLALLGIALATAAAIVRLRQASAFMPRVRAASIIILLVLALVSFVQTSVWADSLTLWTHTLEVNPASWVGNSAMAGILIDRGKPADAIPYARKAIEIQPNYAEAHGNLAVALDETGHRGQALAEYQTVLRINPNSIPARLNLAALYRDLGHPDDARREYEAVLRIQSDNPTALAAVGRTSPRPSAMR